MATKLSRKQRRGLATGVRESRPAPLHYVVAKGGDKGWRFCACPCGERARRCPCSRPGGPPWIPLRRGARRGVVRESVYPR